MNRFIFCGNLSKDIEIRYSQGGTAVASASIAVQRKYKKEGEPTADFFNLKAFGKTAEFMANYMGTKGTRILVEGNIQNSQWQDANGETKYGTNYIVENCYFADRKTDNNTSNEFSKGFEVPVDNTSSFDPGDDLPF